MKNNEVDLTIQLGTYMEILDNLKVYLYFL